MSQRSPRVLALARRYGRRRMRRELDGLWVSGLEHAQAAVRAGPAIFAATHVSWWDAFVIVAVDEALSTTTHCLMDADNLERLPFFGWIGAIPIGRGGARARAGLRHAATLTKSPGEALWIFPQGRQRPAHLRPLQLEPGVRLVARLCRAPVVPVSLNYLFRESERPAALLRFGPAITADNFDSTVLESALVDGLDLIDRFVDTGESTPAFSPLVPAPLAPTQDGLGARMLRWLGQRQKP